MQRKINLFPLYHFFQDLAGVHYWIYIISYHIVRKSIYISQGEKKKWYITAVTSVGVEAIYWKTSTFVWASAIPQYRVNWIFAQHEKKLKSASHYALLHCPLRKRYGNKKKKTITNNKTNYDEVLYHNTRYCSVCHTSGQIQYATTWYFMPDQHTGGTKSSMQQ